MAEEVSEEQLKALAIKEEEEDSKYKAPAEKSIEELQKLDESDEALKRYKEQLLGNIDSAKSSDSRRVVVKKILLNSKDLSSPLTMDLSDTTKKQSFKIKEGAEYTIGIEFKVNNEIVSGLRYSQIVTRKGIKVDKMNLMVGSYAPRADDYTFTTEADEAPSGMLARGTYKVQSKFIDDDKTEHAVWEWQFEIAKKWE